MGPFNGFSVKVPKTPLGYPESFPKLLNLTTEYLTVSFNQKTRMVKVQEDTL